MKNPWLCWAMAFSALAALLTAACRPEQSSRAERDRAALRDLAVGLESYAVDWGCYPANMNYLTVHGEWPGKSEGGMTQGMIIGPWVDGIPVSAFDANITPHYAPLGNSSYPNLWIAAFPGPDGDWDTGDLNAGACDSWQSAHRAFQVDHCWTAEVADKFYDPTNGEISDGDIIRLKQ